MWNIRNRVREKKIQIFVLSGMIFFAFQCLMISFSKKSSSFSRKEIVEESVQRREHVVIAAVACGQMSETAMVMIKSAIILKCESQLTFIIFAEHNMHADFHTRLQRFQSELSPTDSFSYELRNVSYPDDGHDKSRSVLTRNPSYRPCCLLRLYLPALITNYQNVLYVDLDVIFLNELSDSWYHLRQMNPSQIAAVTPDHEDPLENPRQLRQTNVVPFYGSTGLNAGVILMNLRKMREIKWVDEVNNIIVKFGVSLEGADQDIINIFFHDHPDKLYENSCRYNYAYFVSIDRNLRCMKKSLCKDAHVSGVSILHGHSKAFNWVGIFQAIYQSFEQYELGTDVHRNLIEPLRRHFRDKECLSLEKEIIQNLVRLSDKKKYMKKS